MKFNPFNKKISELKYNNLKKLTTNQVSEGQYIEYKKEFISGLDMCKGLAAFANSEGGWFFIGIKDDDITNIATDLIGFELGENKYTPMKNIIEAIEGRIKQHIFPVINFEYNLILLPKTKGVKQKYILVIYVHEGNELPYITSNGLIYERVYSSKEPILPLNKPEALQRLYDKKNKFIAKIEEFSKPDQFEYNFSNPYIEIFCYSTNDAIKQSFSLKNFVLV
jgi:predicted HTH transcriptional regulator